MIPSDPVTASLLDEEALHSGDPDFDPEAALREYGGLEDLDALPSEGITDAEESGTTDEIVETETEETLIVIQVEETPALTQAENVPDNGISEEEAWGDSFNKPENPDVGYTFVPAEERPPESNNDWNWNFIDPIPESTDTRPHFTEPSNQLVTDPELFSVPLLTELEMGKYYVQLASYGSRSVAESEITKIEKGYPLVIQQGKVSGKQVYRILVGPVNHWESGALLQRFKGRGYTGAFVWKGGS